MEIQISTGIGIGPTQLSAFDSALNNAGVANYNLLKLSSVIPPKSKIVINKPHLQSCLANGVIDCMW